MKIPSTAVRRARIEIVPLIDIIFFLLATFVMVSLSMVKNQGISVTLPKAATGQAQERSNILTAIVTITEDGKLFLDKEQVTFDTLPQRLEALHQANPDMRVVFNGDELAYFGEVVKALDETRKLGIEKVAIQTTGARLAPPATQ